MMLPIIDIKLTKKQKKLLAPLFEAIAVYNEAKNNFDPEESPALLMQPRIDTVECRVGFIDTIAAKQVRAAFRRSREREKEPE